MFCRAVVRFFGRLHHSDANTNHRGASDPISLLMQKHLKLRSVKECRQIHAQLVVSEGVLDIFSTNNLLNLYVRCADLSYAQLLFDQTPQKNVVTWTSMISAYVHHESYEKGLQLFKHMHHMGEQPNQFTLSVALRACTNLSYMELGLQIHSLVIKLGLERDEFTGSSIVDMYFKIGGSLNDSCRVFNGLFRRDDVTWNVMISGFAQVGDYGEVIRLFSEMQVVDNLKPNDFTFTSLLKCCGWLGEVEQIHGLVLKSGTDSDLLVSNALIDSYGKCGNADLAQKVINSMEKKDNFAWSSMISGYARNGNGEKAVALFRDMCREGMRPDQHVLSSSLKACVEFGEIGTGIQFHNQLIKYGYQRDCLVASVLLILYIEFNRICDAEKVFRRIADRDTVAWNSMIMGYAQIEGSALSCIKLYCELRQTTMLEPDGATLVAVIKSCQSSSDLDTGVQMHSVIMKSVHSCEILVENAIISMYSKCGAIDDACKAFDHMLHRDEVSWSSIIGSYVQNGVESEALRLCKEMLAHGVCLSRYSLPLCMRACSGLAAIDVGKQFHSFIIKSGLDREVHAGSSIIDMYAKCGNMEDAIKAFNGQQERNEVTFNALISGFAHHGKAQEAVEVFEEMENMNIIPNKITFLAILSAFSHVGLVKESLLFFYLMHQKYGIEPETEHYSCLVDVFGRAGRIEEAHQILKASAGISAWRTLLSACRNYGNSMFGEKSARRMMEVDPSDHAPYILLSNLYSESGRWEEALNLRQKMVNIGVKKDPGSSWLIIREHIHEFMVGDCSHPKIKDISRELSLLNQQLKACY